VNAGLLAEIVAFRLVLASQIRRGGGALADEVSPAGIRALLRPDTSSLG
jgi:hypothetical protein